MVIDLLPTKANRTEDRRLSAIVEAITPYLGRQEAERMTMDVEHDKAKAPYWQWKIVEGPAGKLQRMHGCVRGRKWLAEHPDATWEDIAEAPL